MGEHLPSQHEALSSNPIATKKKNHESEVVSQEGELRNSKLTCEKKIKKKTVTNIHNPKFLLRLGQAS
jgi:hypothetical protein